MGMLWFGMKGRPPSEEIRHAYAYFVEKYGVPPLAVWINPQWRDGVTDEEKGAVQETCEELGIALKDVGGVLPRHYCLELPEALVKRYPTWRKE